MVAGFTAPDRSLFVVSEMDWHVVEVMHEEAETECACYVCVCKSVTARVYVCMCVRRFVYLCVQGHCTECGGHMGQRELTRPATAWQRSSGCSLNEAGHRCCGPSSFQIEVLSVGQQSTKNNKHLISRAISLELISLEISLWMHVHVFTHRYSTHQDTRTPGSGLMEAKVQCEIKYSCNIYEDMFLYYHPFTFYTIFYLLALSISSATILYL